MRRFFQLARKAGWAMTDQGLYALSNLVVSIVLARTLDAAAFGAYSVAFLIFSIAVAVERSMVGQPLQINHSRGSDAEFRSAIGSAMGSSLLIGLAGSVVCLAIGYAGPEQLRVSMTALALTLPILLLHDTARMACFARTDAKGATLLDLAWNVVLAVVLMALIASQHATLFWLTFAWGASATAGLAVAWRRIGVGVAVRRAIGWLRGQASLWGYLLGEYVIGLGAAQVAILLAGALTTTAEVGALRGAQVILGPLGILGTAAFQFAIPELSKREHLSARQRAKLAWLLSLALCAAVPLYVGIVLALPDHYGRMAFGQTWEGARGVLIPMALASFFATLGSGPAVTLYSLGKANVTFWLHAAKAPLLLGGIVVGSLKWGAFGAASTLAITEALLLPAWILVMRRVLDQQGDGPVGVNSELAGNPAAILPGGEVDQAEAQVSLPVPPPARLRGRHRRETNR